MKVLFISLISLLVLSSVHAQVNVSIKGKIDNYQNEVLLISNGDVLNQLQLSSDGSYEIDLVFDNLPGLIQLKSASNKGKLSTLSPVIWLDTNSLELNFNLMDNSFDSSNKLDFQELSQKIENLSEQDQINAILENPNQWPSLYFVNQLKTKIDTEALKTFLNETKEPYCSAAHFKRLSSFVDAKSRTPIKMGALVEDFSLPDKNGEAQSVIQESDKTKLIALFSSGCSFSIASIELLSQLNEMNNDQIEIISIWDDPNEDSWINMHADKKESITWTNLLDQYGFTTTYFDSDISPEFYVVDADGILIDTFHGYTKKTAKKLRKLLED